MEDMDVREKLGIDTIGLQLSITLFGFKNENWKPWRLFDGVEVLVSEHFQISKDKNGDLLLYPCGDITVLPSAKMSKEGFYFDCIVRQEPIDESNLNPKEFAEQFSIYTDEDLKYLQKTVNELYINTDLSIVGNFWQGGFVFNTIHNIQQGEKL